MKDRYVILTGSKNNAGDFLIKYRAKKLFGLLRPDREIIDYDGWKPFTAEQLETVNSSKALILMGGPALQHHMYPGIYPMTKNLSDIKVPVVLMGTGYKDHNGAWDNTGNYQLSPDTLQLLKKIDATGLISSVRDYHTLNVLLGKGFKNLMMTGCPALYEPEFIGKDPVYPAEIKSIGFSLGVSYIQSEEMDQLMKNVISELRSAFPKSEFTVYFHHSINKTVKKQAEMTDWLTKNKIAFKDISNSAEELMKAYTACDLHVGFRVHSHIFSCSVSKPSVLYAEDGRGKALYTVIGGLALDAYRLIPTSLQRKVKSKLGIKQETYVPYNRLGADTINNLLVESANGYPRMRMTRRNIDLHFEEMKKFISQLP